MRRWPGILALVWAAMIASVAQAGPFSSVVSFAPGAAGEGELTVVLAVPADHYLYAERMRVVSDEADGVVFERKSAPVPSSKQVLDESVSVYDHESRFVYTVRGVRAAWGLTVSYQGCNHSMCFAPVRETFRIAPDGVVTLDRGDSALVPVSVPPARPEAGTTGVMELVGRGAGYLPSGEMNAFLDRVAAGQGLGKDRLAGVLERHGPWIALLMILVWGVALNLTPCVLPMIPINLAIIGAGTQSGGRGRGFLLGGVYGVGIAAVYGLLGLAVVLTGAKFGALNSSPWFNLGIAVLFGALALAMFDLFALDFSRFQPTGDASRKTGLAGTFLMGGVAALLAGACVAPVVISVLLLSAQWYAAGQPLGLLLPFLLGAGMALPWPFAGAGLSFLPKPGRWMETVKKGFGVLILVAAGYYGHLGFKLLSDRFVDRKEVVSAQTRQAKEDGWLVSLDEGLSEAAISGKPVFVDFWASWCKNCLRMEKTTFRDPEVRRRLDGYVRVKFQAEDMAAPEIRAVLDRYGVVGLPTYVVLRSKGGAEGMRP